MMEKNNSGAVMALTEKVLLEEIRVLEQRNRELESRDREYRERTEELLAQTEELTAAIEAFMEKSELLQKTVIELSQRNNELDQILYRTSHDLISPLTSIEGVLQLIPAEALPPDLREMHRHMGMQTGLMKDVLKSLRGLAHASFDKLDIAEVDIKASVTNVINELAYLGNYPHTKFIVDIEENLLLETDSFLFAKLMESMLSNAVIYRESLQPGFVSVKASQLSGNLVLDVTSDTEYISNDHIEKIFEMFFRASHRSKGCGLGLYVARRIAGRFGGTLTAKNESGLITFTLTLPQQNQNFV